MRNLSFYSSKCDKIHLLPHQNQLRLPETTEGALPFINTALLLGAAEGNGTPYKLQTSFLIITDSKAWLTETSYAVM